MTDARQDPALAAAYRERIDEVLAEHAGAVGFPFSGHVFDRRGGFNPAVLTLDTDDGHMLIVERLPTDERPRVGLYLAHGPRVVVAPVAGISPHSGIVRPVSLAFEIQESGDLVLRTRDMSADEPDDAPNLRPVLDVGQLGRLRKLVERRIEVLIERSAPGDDGAIAESQRVATNLDAQMEHLANRELAQHLALDFELCDRASFDRLFNWVSRGTPRA